MSSEYSPVTAMRGPIDLLITLVVSSVVIVGLPAAALCLMSGAW